MSVFQDLVSENPMLIEMKRFIRRFLGISQTSVLNVATLIIVILIYLLILALVSVFDTGVTIKGLGIFLFVLLSFVVPTIMQGSVAGERERRSWEMLICAPITKAQIVIGKFLSGAAAVGAICALMAVPMMMAQTGYSYDIAQIPTTYGSQPDQPEPPPLPTKLEEMIRVEVVCVAYGLALVAFTLLASSRSRKSITALAVTYAFLILGLVVAPAILGMLIPDANAAAPFMYLHPYTAIEQDQYTYNMYNSSNPADNVLSAWHGIPQALVYLCFVAIFLIWAEKTLHFPESEAAFIPRSHDAGS